MPGGAAGAAALVDANNGYMDIALWQKIPVTHSIVASMMPRYSNYSLIDTEVPVEYGLNQHSTSVIKFDPSGLGDYWGCTKLFMALPALARNTSAGALAGRQNDAYWVQNVGYAAIQKFELYIGQQVAITSTGQDCFQWYQEHSPAAKYPIDTDIGRYMNEAQLKQASQTNQMIAAPLLMSVFRSARTDRHFPLLRFFNQSVHLELTLQSLLALTVNQYALSLVPYLYGTTTPVSSSNVTVRIFSTFLILSTEERTQVALKEAKHLIMQSQTFTYYSTESVGKLISVAPVFNHTTRAIKLYFLPDNYIDGSTYSPCGVGLKNYFDYSAPHGGEALADVNLKFNQTAVIDNGVPPAIPRSLLTQDNCHRINYSSVYLIPFQRRLNTDDLNHGCNLSGIDKIAVECRKNHSSAGTLSLVVDNVNLIASINGYGGVPFSG